MIELQWDFFQYDFMRTALAAGLAASVLCGLIGIYVILNKIVFISDGIAHAPLAASASATSLASTLCPSE